MQYNVDWRYIAGYLDGEATLLFGIIHDTRKNKTKGSKVDGWNIVPSWQITSFDLDVLSAIKEFLDSQGIKTAKWYLYPYIRPHQTQKVARIAVFGWDNLENFIKKILPYTIAKKKQFELFLELKNIVKGSRKHHKWTKEKFIHAMECVDKINELKKGKRGKLNAQYFKELWGMG